eukprot:1719822-Rhodomonas_salina.2
MISTALPIDTDSHHPHDPPRQVQVDRGGQVRPASHAHHQAPSIRDALRQLRSRDPPGAVLAVHHDPAPEDRTARVENYGPN